MSETPKKPGAAFWACVMLCGLILYVLSWGPVCWIAVRPGTSDDPGPVFQTVYWPLGRVIFRDVPVASHFLIWYAQIGIEAGCYLDVPGKLDDEKGILITDDRLLRW